MVFQQNLPISVNTTEEQMNQSRVATKPEQVKKHYEAMVHTIAAYRKTHKRPLTLSEKILASHLHGESTLSPTGRGKDFLLLRPDRVALQDATAQMAILQFIQSQREQVALPTTVHCDHLIRAYQGVEKDMAVANQENEAVFEFLRSSCQKYGIGFWQPGAGIIHQVVFENYAFPGGLMIGTDSHTPNAGGLGMLAIGVGGADAVEVMAARPWELLSPKIVAVKLTGKLKGWTSSKDVILKVLDILTVSGGTNKIVEYIGPGAESISCTGKGTITNMGAELGATTSVFAFDGKMAAYLRATKRVELAVLAEQYAEHLRPDPEVVADPKRYYDEVYEIDLSQLEPHMCGPHTPDLARPVSKLAAEVREKSYPANISACLVGSCTNSSYEDIYKAAAVAKEALKVGIRAKVPLLISPGSMQIFSTIKRDGLLATLEEFGGVVLANACGPCIGQWQRDDFKKGEANSIVTSFNRNFRGRNDGNAETLGFITSPEMVIAFAAAGNLTFNPLNDTLVNDKGQKVSLTAPTAPELPPAGFAFSDAGYSEPPLSGKEVKLAIDPQSDRLEILAPFARWDGKDFIDHLLLAKVAGKCTTDHISPAGKWLRFRGHLTNISKNMLLGANNAFYSKEPGCGLNQLSGKAGETLADIAFGYKAAGKRWMIVGDENYGEGSSREHAAMSPRFLGASTVLVKSFARIHETNLKKQGILALTFAKPGDYDLIGETDLLSVVGLQDFRPGKVLTLEIKKTGGKIEKIPVHHSYNEEQIRWFKAGSCLNSM
jgi:aconitate hydratase